VLRTAVVVMLLNGSVRCIPPHFGQVALAVGCASPADSHHRVYVVHTPHAPAHRQGALPLSPGVTAAECESLRAHERIQLLAFYCWGASGYFIGLQYFFHAFSTWEYLGDRVLIRVES
jgi:hypothetical protein